MKKSEALLRRALLANATFSIFCGVIGSVFHEHIAHWMGIQNPDILLSIGISLTLFAAYVAFNGIKKEISPYQVIFIIIQDWIWVIGSAALLITNTFEISIEGNWLIGIVALFVACFAITQQIGLKQIKTNE